MHIYNLTIPFKRWRFGHTNYLLAFILVELVAMMNWQLNWVSFGRKVQ